MQAIALCVIYIKIQCKMRRRQTVLKKNIGMILSLIILLISFFIPEGGGLSSAAIRTIGLSVAFLCLLVTEALPLSITCWTMLVLMPMFGVVQGFPQALTGFSNPVVFFILGSFGISAAFTTLPLSKRIMIVLLKYFGKNIKSFLFALMLCILPITAFISSVPACTLFMAIGLSFLELFENEDDKKATGRAFMIAIPVTCLFGGMATPVGSTMNLLALDLLEQYTGQIITFVQWMSVGVPLVILVLPIWWLLVYKIYKPAEINENMVKTFIERLNVPSKMNTQEKKVLAITSIMIILWIMSSWVSQINVIMVTLLGTCIMFFPGIQVLEWKSFIKGVNLDPVFLLGTVLSIGNAMIDNGVSDWISSLFPSSPMALPMLMVFTVLLVLGILIIMPVAPSVVMFLAVPLIALAEATGHNPTLIILTLGMASGNCYLLPLDTIPLITYGSGYYSMLDLPKSTLFLQMYILILLPLVLWVASSVLHII